MVSDSVQIMIFEDSGSSLRSAGGDMAHDFVDASVGEFSQFLLRQILDWVFKPHDCRLKTKSFALSGCCWFELFGCDKASWYTTLIESQDVMQTARRT